MEIETWQKRINATDYWDCKVLDFSINYFGDEVRIVMSCNGCSESEDNERQVCCIIKFLLCYQVEYITDAKDNVWRKDYEVKNMNRHQLGHYMQEIKVTESDVNGFFEVSLNTSLLFAKIVCKNLIVENTTETDFFWSINKK